MYWFSSGFYEFRPCLHDYAGQSHPPIKIRSLIVDVHGAFDLTWHLLADDTQLGRTILAVVTHGTIEGKQGATIYHDRTLIMYLGNPFSPIQE